jgi:hypothetical protein
VFQFLRVEHLEHFEHIEHLEHFERIEHLEHPEHILKRQIELHLRQKGYLRNKLQKNPTP